jgi:hypothetical protein
MRAPRYGCLPPETQHKPVPGVSCSNVLFETVPVNRHPYPGLDVWFQTMLMAPIPRLGCVVSDDVDGIGEGDWF